MEVRHSSLVQPPFPELPGLCASVEKECRGGGPTSSSVAPAAVLCAFPWSWRWRDPAPVVPVSRWTEPVTHGSRIEVVGRPYMVINYSRDCGVVPVLRWTSEASSRPNESRLRTDLSGGGIGQG